MKDAKDEEDTVWQERRLEEILYSNLNEADKLNQLVDLGYSQEVAGNLMEQHNAGTQTPVYYETLNDEPKDNQIS